MRDAKEMAQALLSARRGGAPVALDSISTDQAYEVQALVAEALGPVGGFKYAKRPGTSAILAPIQASNVHSSPARFDSGGQPVGVELEVGFHFDAAAPDPDAPDFLQRLRQSVTPVAAIELVQTRLADLNSASAEMKLADHQLNGGLVVGDAALDWTGETFGSVNVRLSFDDETVVNGAVPLPFGPAFDCLADLVRMVGTHCGGLRPGHVVITGSLNGLPWLAPGTHIEAEIAGIGEVTADLA